MVETNFGPLLWTKLLECRLHLLLQAYRPFDLRIAKQRQVREIHMLRQCWGEYQAERRMQPPEPRH